MSIRNLSNHSCSIIHLYAIDLVTTVKGTQQQVFSRKQANKPKDRLKGQNAWSEVPGAEGRYPDEGIRSMCAHIGINQLLHGDGIAIEMLMSKRR